MKFLRRIAPSVALACLVASTAPAHGQGVASESSWQELDVYQGSFVGMLTDLTFSFEPEAGYAYRLHVHGSWFDPDMSGLVGYDLSGHHLEQTVRWVQDVPGVFTAALQSQPISSYTLTVYGANLGLVSSSLIHRQSLPVVSQVPEPATYAMLLLGLGLVVTAVSRAFQFSPPSAPPILGTIGMH